MRRKKALLIALAVLILGGGLAGGLYWRWLNSPRYALQQMALALETKNMVNFFNYLDLKAIFNNLLEDSTQDRSAPQDPGADEWTRMTRFLGQKFAKLLLPQLFETFQGQIRTAMEKYLLNLDNSQVLAIAAAVTVARIDTHGDVALVTLTDPKTKEPLRFEMQRYQKDKVWRIVSVNYLDLKRFYRRQFR